KRSADRENAIADLRGGTVAQLQVGEGRPLGAEEHDGQVGPLVAADVLGRELPSVLEGDGHAFGAVNDVEVGEDDAAGVNEEARAEAELRRLVEVRHAAMIFEKAAQLVGD